MMLQATARAGEFGDASEICLGNTQEARWYDPEAGVFLGIDPVVADAGDPQAFNAYAYARNNPARYTDPDGLTTIHDSPSDLGLTAPGGLDSSTKIVLERKPTWAQRREERIRQIKSELTWRKNVECGKDLYKAFFPLPGSGSVGGAIKMLKALLTPVAWLRDIRPSEDHPMRIIRRLELELRDLGEEPFDPWFDKWGQPRSKWKEEQEEKQRKKLELEVGDPDSASAPGVSGSAPVTGMGGSGGGIAVPGFASSNAAAGLVPFAGPVIYISGVPPPSPEW